MNLTNKEIKQRYFAKVYQNAVLIKCKCGCGQELKNKDRYGRNKIFINGHNGRKYTDKMEHKRAWNKKNRQGKKVILIQYKGGKCVRCGLAYNGKNGSVFDFHHLKDKKFGISGATIYKTIEELKIETDKCYLICSNCHRLEHNGEF